MCGGMLIDLIARKNETRMDLTDASSSARILYQRFEGSLVEALRLSRHGRDLEALGLGEDLFYCAQTDITDLVPTFSDGVIKSLECGMRSRISGARLKAQNFNRFTSAFSRRF